MMKYRHLPHESNLKWLALLLFVSTNIALTTGFRHFAEHVERIPSEVHLFFSKFEDNVVSTGRNKRAEPFGDQVRALEDLIRIDPNSAAVQAELNSICQERGYLSPAQGECNPLDVYRTIDGSCNNLNNPYWGKSMTPFKRLIPAQYSDNVSAFRRSVTGAELPSARRVSTLVVGQENVVDPYRGSDFIMHFGQFLDHDIDQAPVEAETCLGCTETEVCRPIAVAADDPALPPPCFMFRRSLPTINGDCRPGPRNQINQITSYVDGSLIYGNNPTREALLRAPTGGELLTMDIMGSMLNTLPNDNMNSQCAVLVAEQKCALSGDGRTAEQPGLTAIHVTFVREHNRIARELRKLNRHWDHERLYQETRKIVGAMLQHIVYNEYLPLMLGAEIMNRYELKISRNSRYQYDPSIQASASHQFATASFRNGHSQINEAMLRLDQDFNKLAESVPLKLAFFNATYAYDVMGGSLESILLGTLVLPVQKVDNNFAEAVNDQLFADPLQAFGMDLVAINTQRGRDHGLGTYNDYREVCGMSRITNFEELRSIMPDSAVDGIIAAYAHPDDIDLFIGSFSENVIPGTLQGPTSSCLVGREFQRLKFGDRFWYENRQGPAAFSVEQIAEIKKSTYSRIICNTIYSVKYIQPYAFRLPDSSSKGCIYDSFVDFSQQEDFPNADGELPGFVNKLVRCDNYDAIPQVELWPWKEFPKLNRNDL
ncbi:Peroxidasin [Holothuria leucospilota]|uniref:Peroxidasin n=1 Tax=Holothuria leucospilota TaxID=206669 RepID=A0A9Q1CDP0_HOLLE|nr:Peroxidasin [Holothuria leucospilota]